MEQKVFMTLERFVKRYGPEIRQIHPGVTDEMILQEAQRLLNGQHWSGFFGVPIKERLAKVTISEVKHEKP